jgi:hypothetical protein
MPRQALADRVWRKEAARVNQRRAVYYISKMLKMLANRYLSTR